jgi:hypothetical protein
MTLTTDTETFTLSHSAKKGKLDSVNVSTGVKQKDIDNSESTEQYVI